MADFAGDMAAITSIINRYSLAMDSKNFALMDDVFTPTAEIFLGEMRFNSRQRGVAAISACIHCCSVTHHMNSNIYADIVDDRAHVVSRFRAWHQGVGARAHETFEGLGTYEDEFIRTAVGWRIEKRVEQCPIM